MSNNSIRIGLRLLEFECGISTNIDATHSAELVDYELSRIAGQSARLAMLIKGQDVIEDEQRLKKIVAIELGITPAEYNEAKQYLLEVDLLEERLTRAGKHVINEKVNRLNHADNYERIGNSWLKNQNRSPKEESLILTLDTLIQTPTQLNDIDAINDLKNSEKDAVLELGSNAGLIDVVDEERMIYYSPLLWDVNPRKLASYMKKVNQSSFSQVLSLTKKKQGIDVTNTADTLILQAISGGILPSYRITSTGGPRVYGFSPYTGNLLSSDEEITILDKARALVACLRYGSEAATITRIRNPLWILEALTDSNRNYSLKPHSELKLQYGMLIAKQLGRIIQTRNNRFIFQLIPTPDNLRACEIAKELIKAGETMGEKDPGANITLHLANGNIDHPLKEVKIAKRKRPARTDELAGLVELLQSV